MDEKTVAIFTQIVEHPARKKFIAIHTRRKSRRVCSFPRRVFTVSTIFI